ncbi:hypothetical protein EMPG_13089 [Blastomyces silverae]|uniref:Uncharacterized protein n=1 Tax=Blastomyces silverae TaxID=2060906 RepID=A0A0H1BRH2_9EURO|nr:hypothetical protein EMPG_13089 [Blastomyces silverae]
MSTDTNTSAGPRAQYGSRSATWLSCPEFWLTSATKLMGSSNSEGREEEIR